MGHKREFKYFIDRDQIECGVRKIRVAYDSRALFAIKVVQ